MSINADDRSNHRRAELDERGRFSTLLFTRVNIAVFLVLASSVVVAGVLYSQGA
jgi:hypothetical protein